MRIRDSRYDDEFFFKSLTITNEEKVIYLVNKGLKNEYDLTIDEFLEIYNNLLKNNPEKLI